MVAEVKAKADALLPKREILYSRAKDTEKSEESLPASSTRGPSNCCITGYTEISARRIDLC